MSKSNKLNDYLLELSKENENDTCFDCSKKTFKIIYKKFKVKFLRNGLLLIIQFFFV